MGAIVTLIEMTVKPDCAKVSLGKDIMGSTPCFFPRSLRSLSKCLPPLGLKDVRTAMPTQKDAVTLSYKIPFEVYTCHYHFDAA